MFDTIIAPPRAKTTPETLRPKRFVSAHSPKDAMANIEDHTAKCQSGEIKGVSTVFPLMTINYLYLVIDIDVNYVNVIILLKLRGARERQHIS